MYKTFQTRPIKNRQPNLNQIRMKITASMILAAVATALLANANVAIAMDASEKSFYFVTALRGDVMLSWEGQNGERVAIESTHPI